jgi:hypothetical protein
MCMKKLCDLIILTGRTAPFRRNVASQVGFYISKFPSASLKLHFCTTSIDFTKYQGRSDFPHMTKFKIFSPMEKYWLMLRLFDIAVQTVCSVG